MQPPFVCLLDGQDWLPSNQPNTYLICQPRISSSPLPATPQPGAHPCTARPASTRGEAYFTWPCISVKKNVILGVKEQTQGTTSAATVGGAGPPYPQPGRGALTAYCLQGGPGLEKNATSRPAHAWAVAKGVCRPGRECTNKGRLPRCLSAAGEKPH